MTNEIVKCKSCGDRVAINDIEPLCSVCSSEEED